MLQTQLLDIPLQGGLAEQFDKRLVPQGAWLAVKNCRRFRQQGFSKRYGITALTQAITPSGSISSCVNLGSLDNQLVLFDSTTLYAYSSTLNKWANRSQRLDSAGTAISNNKLFPATIIERSLYTTANQIIAFDWCLNSDGLIHCAYEQVFTGVSNHAIWEFIYDPATETIIRGPVQVDTNGYAPKIFALNGTVIVVYAQTSAGDDSILARSRTGVNAFGGTTILANNKYKLVSTSAFDAQPISDSFSFLIIYEDSVNANPVTVKQFDSTLALQGSSRWTTVATNWSAFTLDRAAVTAEGIWCAGNRTAGGLNNTFATRVTSNTCVQQFVPAQVLAGIPTGTAGRTDRLTISRLDANRGGIFGSNADTYTSIAWLARNTITSGGVAGTQKNLLGYNLVSRLFMGPDGRAYFWARDVTFLDSSLSVLAGTLFLVDAEIMLGEGFQGRVTGRAFTRILDNTANSFAMGHVVSNVCISGNTVYCPAPVLQQLNTTNYLVQMAIATYSDPVRFKSVQVGGTLYFAPGQQYDGNRVSEIGYHRVPDFPTITDFGAGGLSQGVYQYRVVIRHINSRGETVRSSPSAAASITLAAGHQTTVGSVFGGFTDKQDPDTGATTTSAEPQVAELYRTVANGSIFYLCQEKLLPIGGSTSVTFVDTLADTSLSSKPILYTLSLAPNLSPPNLKCPVVWRNRLCGIGTDLHTVWISSEYISGNQVTFNEAFNAVLPSDEITALAVLDDKLILFTSTQVFLLDGEPANFLGEGNTLVPQPISADVGCTDERGIVTHDEGVIFKDRLSFSIVGRNLSVESVGLPVIDELAAYPTISSGTVIDRDREARFTLKTLTGTTGIVLSYSSDLKAWTTHEFYNSVAASALAPYTASTTIDGQWYAATSSGVVFKEDSTTYTDGGTFVNMSITSPWIKLAEIGGFQRVKRLLMQAERFTPHDLQIDFYIDGNETPVQTISITNTTIAAMPGLPIERIMRQLQYQKCSYLKFRIQDITPSGGAAIGTGQGLALFGVTLQLGVKPGVSKLLSDAQKT